MFSIVRRPQSPAASVKISREWPRGPGFTPEAGILSCTHVAECGNNFDAELAAEIALPNCVLLLPSRVAFF